MTEYSAAMKKLIAKQSYNSGLRPSGHNISPTGFLKEHKGAIPSNVLRFNSEVDAAEYEQMALFSNVIKLSNTLAGDQYRRYCLEHGIAAHPAPMPMKLVEFFVKFLTVSTRTTGQVGVQKKHFWWVVRETSVSRAASPRPV